MNFITLVKFESLVEHMKSQWPKWKADFDLQETKVCEHRERGKGNALRYYEGKEEALWDISLSNKEDRLCIRKI